MPTITAAQIRQQFPDLAPTAIAAACEITLTYERLPLAFGQTIYLAECFFTPPSVVVNSTAIEKLSLLKTDVTAQYQPWFRQAALLEVIVAHELYHIFSQLPSTPHNETAAHQFAQTLTGLPFSPRLYETILQQALGCKLTTNII